MISLDEISRVFTALGFFALALVGAMVFLTFALAVIWFLRWLP